MVINYMTMRFTKSILLLIISSVFTLTSCTTILLKATGEYPSIEVDGDMAKINGVLGKQFHKKFEKFIKENPEIKDLVLQNIPGSINDEWNVKTCMLIHHNCMNTILQEDSEIASGGVDLFISGNNRTIVEGAQIGVHSWRDLKQDGADYPKDSDEHTIFLDFFREINVDTAFYWFTLDAAEGKSIHWMTQEELELYKLEITIDSSNTCFNN